MFASVLFSFWCCSLFFCLCLLLCVSVFLLFVYEFFGFVYPVDSLFHPVVLGFPFCMRVSSPFFFVVSSFPSLSVVTLFFLSSRLSFVFLPSVFCSLSCFCVLPCVLDLLPCVCLLLRSVFFFLFCFFLFVFSFRVPPLGRGEERRMRRVSSTCCSPGPLSGRF